MGFELPRFRTCCCGCTLRTGALIIGYLSVLSTIFVIISTVAMIVVLAKFVDDSIKNPPQGHTPENVRNAATTLYILYAFNLLLSVFYLVISLLLVIGAHKNKPQLMKYYFIAGMVNLGLNLILIIVNFVFAGFISTVIQLIGCGIVFYFLLVVRSCYLEMEEEQAKPPIAQPRIYELQDINKQQQPLMA